MKRIVPSDSACHGGNGRLQACFVNIEEDRIPLNSYAEPLIARGRNRDIRRLIRPLAAVFQLVEDQTQVAAIRQEEVCGKSAGCGCRDALPKRPKLHSRKVWMWANCQPSHVSSG